MAKGTLSIKPLFDEASHMAFTTWCMRLASYALGPSRLTRRSLFGPCEHGWHPMLARASFEYWAMSMHRESLLGIRINGTEGLPCFEYL